jgi:glycosyltransferase involved in cell wall biosynthesis
VISIVIPAYNAARTLDECLQAVRCSDYDAYEVIVVDDASTDSSAAVAACHACRVVHLPENVGAAVAKNFGAREAAGDIILFTDADILLPPDALGWVAENLSDPTVAGVVGLLGPKLRYGNFSSQFKNLWMYHTYARLARSRAAQDGVGLFFTSVAAIRKDVFVAQGGFDSHYRGASITEDVEFGQRLLTAGHKIRLDGRLAVEHLKRYTFGELLKTDLKRAFGLTKTWLRKRLESAHGGVAHKHYTSVPWSFILSVPLTWLLPVLVLLFLWTGMRVWLWAALLDYASILVVNMPFLSTLLQARGWVFLLQSCLFLPLDLWVSGLGALWAIMDYLAGNRY